MLNGKKYFIINIDKIGGYSPYLERWNEGGIENEHIEEKVIEKAHIDIDDYLDHFDMDENGGPLSALNSHRISIVSDEKHTENDIVDRVDIDIESCIDPTSSVSSSSSSEFDPDHDDILQRELLRQQNIHKKHEEETYPINQQQQEQPKVVNQEKEEKEEIQSQKEENHDNNDDDGDNDEDQKEEEEEDEDEDCMIIKDDDDADSITIKLEQQKLIRERRFAMIAAQKKKYRERNRFNKNNKKNKKKKTMNLSAEKSDIIGYNMPIPQITCNKDMVSMDKYNELKEELKKWQNTAHRWQNMANEHERSHESTQIKLQEKEFKYKRKIHDQQKEILKLNKLLKKTECELETKIFELRQLESTSNTTIQQLLTYKISNELRKQNSYIDGTLWKFTGDGMNNVKFNKQPRLKYVMYVPTKRKLYYSDSTHDDAETKLVNVTHITSHKKQENMINLPDKYKNTWIKIIGQNRIVLFVAKNQQDADRWYRTIKNSLQQFNNDES